jgi:uncharacterized protein YkwD
VAAPPHLGRLLRLAAALAACALALSATPAGAGGSPCPGAWLLPGAAPAAPIATATLCLVNRIRRAAGLPELRANPALAGVAGSQVRRMIRQGYFADVGPGDPTPLALVAATRYPAHAASVVVGQNIAWGTGAAASPAQIVASWMASRPHRAIILNRGWRDAAVAARPGVPSALGEPGPGATYAMEFAVRRR